MITEGLRSLLLAQSSVTGTVGSSGAYIQFAPQGVNPPFIVISRVDTERPLRLDGSGGMRMADIDIECWSTTPTKAAALAKTVADVLDDYTGAAGSETVEAVLLQGESDGEETPTSGEDVVRFYTLLDFSIHYLPA